MQVAANVGDVLKQRSDVLISTANPWLNLSGGVNGAILARCGLCIQEELHGYLKSRGISAVPAGTVISSGSHSLPFSHIIHAVAIDPFYDSSVELVRDTLTSALVLALALGATTVASPTLATGYGPMSMSQFAVALKPLTNEIRFEKLRLTIVVRSSEDAAKIEDVLSGREA